MNKHGQSIIEYTLIAILVILGIVYMGPYVLRSVNGYFKLWDSGVQDSFEEGLKQAPVNDIPNIPFNCACSPPVDEGCGTSGCAASDRAYAQTCTPLGCNGAQATTCTFDPTCCNLTPAGCGTYPLPSPPSVPAGPPPINPLTNCYYGQKLMTSGCTPVCNPPSITTNCAPAPECVTDSTCPPPACTGSFPNAGGVLCTGVSPAQNIDYSYLHLLPRCSSCPSTSKTCSCDSTACTVTSIGKSTTCTCPPTAPPCQYACAAGYAQNTNCSIEYHVAAAIVCNNCGAYCCTNNKSKKWCADSSTVYTTVCSYMVTGSCTLGPPAVNSGRCGYKDADQCPGDCNTPVCYTNCSDPSCPAHCLKKNCCPPYAVPRTLCQVCTTPNPPECNL